MYGLANFLELGMFGKVGAGGLHPIRMRQDERHSTLTADICRSFELLEAVFQVQPRRVFEVMHHACPRFFAASDAALEVPGAGTGGFRRNAHAELREGFVAQIPLVPGVDAWRSQDCPVGAFHGPVRPDGSAWRVPPSQGGVVHR